MKQFFSTLFRWLGLLRNILVNGVFILLLLLFAAAFFVEQPQVPDDAALILNPRGSIVEELALPSTSGLPLNISAPNQTQLRDLISVVKRASDDARIRLMVLKLDEMDKTSLPKLQALRKAIEQFKAAGKMVVAIGPNYSQSQYYLAATADHIFLNPLGVVGIEGFSIYRNYIKDALDKLHVDIQLFRAGKYKAAIEPLVRNDMSDEDMQSNRALLDVLWSAYKNDIASMRNIKAERLQTVLDSPSKYLRDAGGSTAELAKAEGLIDALADRGSIEDYIAGAMSVQSGEYDSIDFRQYLRATGAEPTSDKNAQVGIITASGMILDGKQPPGSVGSVSMIEMLNQARLDAQIKAVVLRIDSPGGSAQASEAIRSAVVRLKKAGKPVVVSMAGMAASGGYWIATPADQIWALPTTITGSIGAFGVLPNFQHSLEQLGVHSDGLGTTSIAGGIRSDRALPPELVKMMQLSMQHIYHRFLQVVASGRKMPIATVAALAEGRVWSGLDAQRLGLVDSLGDLNDAVKAAAILAGIEQDYGTVRITRPLGLRDMIMVELFGNADTLASQIFAQVFSHISARLSIVSQAWLPAPLWQDMADLSYLVDFSEGKPGIFAMCNLHVE
ncbi:MAG: signal peptide peptidase SppA [Mariprofundus sp.]|nr:signal peptide peptidase SppA [Mariprofundus sp.]